MRALGTIILAFIISGFVAGMVQVQLGIWFNAQEELIGVMMGQALVGLAVAAAFGALLILRRPLAAIDSVGAKVSIFFIIALVAIEAYALVNTARQGGSLAQTLLRDVPILVEIGVPALLAIFIQWWWVRRSVIRRQAAKT